MSSVAMSSPKSAAIERECARVMEMTVNDAIKALGPAPGELIERAVWRACELRVCGEDRDIESLFDIESLLASLKLEKSE